MNLQPSHKQQKQHQRQGQQHPLDDQIKGLVELLERLASFAQRVDSSKQPVDEPCAVLVGVGRGGGGHDGAAEPAVEGARRAGFKRALNVAKQNQQVLVGVVVGVVDEGLIKQHGLAVATAVILASDIGIVAVEDC